MPTTLVFKLEKNNWDLETCKEKFEFNYFFFIVLQQESPIMELLLSKGLGTIASGHQLMVKGPWPWKQWCMTAMQL